MYLFHGYPGMCLVDSDCEFIPDSLHLDFTNNKLDYVLTNVVTTISCHLQYIKVLLRTKLY